MIIAVRLKEQNKKKKYMMKSYTSASSTTYRTGQNGIPSPWRVIKTKAEAMELQQIAQFEVKKFNSIDDLRQTVQNEMESNARIGLPAVRAAIEGDLPKVRQAAKRDLSILEPKDSDPDFREIDEILEGDDVGPDDGGVADGDEDNGEGDDEGAEGNEDDAEEDEDDLGDYFPEEKENSESDEETSPAVQADGHEIDKARVALADAKARNLSPVYITRLENKLKKLLAGK